MSIPSLSHPNQDLLNEFIELHYLTEEELNTLIEELFPGMLSVVSFIPMTGVFRRRRGTCGDSV